MASSPYASLLERSWYCLHRVLCVAVLIFLVAPTLVIVPLSFNSEPFFTFPMPGLSLRWYEQLFLTDRWMGSLYNSIFVAALVTLLSSVLGTFAALGLSRPNFPWRTAVMSLLISPMVVPVVITAVGLYFFYADTRLLNTFAGLVLAHTTLATPFVVITVTATLVGFDHSLTRAAASLGGPPVTSFFKITLPLVLPGVISGALFAFITSFDEVVVALFITSANERTLPKVMFSGVNQEINPAIAAAATVLTLFAIVMLSTVELLRRRSERLRGRH